MPSTTPASLVRPIIERAIDAAWAQWGALGPLAAKRAPMARSMVDPEALVLGSLGLALYERRLAGAASWWAHAGSTLLSVQRMKNLAGGYPGMVTHPLAAFARTAFEEGDHRWRALADANRALGARAKDLTATPTLAGGPALLLRLRLGLGVGIKADVIAFLLGMGGSRQTIPAIAKSTGYYPRAVRRAVEELVGSGLVHAVATSPASYRVDPGAWRTLLQFSDDPPPWRHWNAIYEFVVRLAAWAEEQRDGVSRYVLGSRARDLMEAHRPRLELAVRLPTVVRPTGEDYLNSFRAILDEIGDWMRASV
ncbi:MAG: hypothetical protein HY700_11685 [Gemmatimonadetes bacterium]|nr:hypothetical protein [Gemmatimonadota bacterium]